MRSHEALWKGGKRTSVIERSDYLLTRLIKASFEPIFDWTVEATIVLSIFYAVYVAFFDKRDIEGFRYYYIFEFVYLFDTSTAYIHRFHHVRNFVLATPRNLLILVMDTLSLLPVYEFCLIVYPQVATPWLERNIQLKTILRTIHLVAHLFVKKFASVEKDIVMLKITHMLLLLLLNLVFSLGWSYEGRCWPNCTSPNWTDALQYLVKLNASQPSAWFLISYTTIGDVLIHGSPGFIFDQNDKESLIIITSLIVGFSMHSLFEIAHTFNNYIFVLQRRYEYRLHLIKLHKLFELTEITNERLLKYYKMLWRRRHCEFSSGLLGLIPNVLLSEAMSDIYLEPLYHSHFFAGQSFEVKSKMCINMQTHYYLPGDNLLELDTPYHSMMYLYSGLLHVLSPDDDTTPILTLAPGTLLGEVSLRMILRPKVIVRCAVKCEIKVLQLTDFNRLVTHYCNNEFGFVTRSLQKRIQFARERKAAENPREKFKVDIMRLKKKWRMVMKQEQMESKSNEAEKEIAELPGNSNYFDLIVIKELNYIDDTITCATKKCPYIMNPNSSLNKYFRYLHVFVVTLHALYLPYFYIYLKVFPIEMHCLNFCIDMVLIRDIYIQSISFVLVDGYELLDIGSLLLYKFKDFFFLVDFFTSIPYDYVLVFEKANFLVHFYLRLPKLIQWYKLIELVTEKEAQAVSHIYWWIIVKYFTIYFTLIYFSIWYHYFFFDFGQIDNPSIVMPVTSLVDRPLMNCVMYIVNAICLWSVADRSAVSVHGLVMYTVLTFVGCYVYNFLIVELSSNLVKDNQLKYEYIKHYDHVQDFLIANGLAVNYKSYFNATYSFLWDFNRNLKFIPDRDTPEYNIFIKDVIRTIKQVPAFVDYPEELYRLLAEHCKIQMHPHGFILSDIGDRAIHFHILAKGYCSIKPRLPRDSEKNFIKIMQAGDCLNFLEVVHAIDSFSTIQTLTECKIFSICITDFYDVIQTVKHEHAIFQTTALWHHKKYSRILESKYEKAGMKKRRRPKPFQGKKLKSIEYFTYEIYDEISPDIFTSKFEVKLRIKSRHGFLYRFLLSKTIDQHGRFFTYWEMGRSLMLLTLAFLALGTNTVLQEYSQMQKGMILCCGSVQLVDIYIRFHVQYYDENNVKITDIRKTAWHYLTTSMGVDLYSTIPFNVLFFSYKGAYKYYFNIIFDFTYFIALMHRPMQGLAYLCNTFNEAILYPATTIYYGVIISAILGVFGNNMLQSCCEFSTANLTYNCNGTRNFISTSPFSGQLKLFHVLILQMYLVSERVHSDIVGMSEFPYMSDIIETLVTTFCLWSFKVYLVVKIISYTIGANAVIINKTKARFNTFSTFVKRELLAEKDVEEVKGHWEYVESKFGNRSMNSLLENFSDKVRLDIKCLLFSQTLELTKFFEKTPKKSLLAFYEYLDTVYFKINANIIRCNDIQSKIYIVQKGAVQIIVANNVLTTLRQGGMFGCFSDKGATRQTILAKALVHVELLGIESKYFPKFLEPFPQMLQEYRQCVATGVEYIDSIRNIDLERSVSKVKIGRIKKIKNKTKAKHSSRASVLSYSTWFQNYHEQMNKLIRFDSVHYRRYSTAVIHLAALSSILLIFVTFTRDLRYIVTLVYFFDAFFWVNIFISFHMQYVDAETGICITSPKLIRRRYARSLSFWVTFIGTLPIEIIGFMANAAEFTISCCFANRLLRFVLVSFYNHSLKKKLAFSRAYQLTYIAYLLIFQIGLMSLIWNTVACHFQTCMYRMSTGPVKVMGTSNHRNNIILSILYVINIFSSAGMRTVSSVTISQVVVTMIISWASLSIMSLMIGILTALLMLKDITMNQYKVKVEKIKKYFVSLDLSPFLVKKVCIALVTLWMRRRGEPKPLAITKAPPYIQQDIMFSMYGHHLTRHHLFQRLHVDMIRQICVHLRIGLYTPNQVITTKGSRDGCMYFLHRGDLQVYDRTDDPFIVSGTFSFGDEQGIFDLPHQRTYYAFTTIDLLLLNREDWFHLCDWFPASKEIISQNNIYIAPSEPLASRITEDLILAEI